MSSRIFSFFFFLRGRKEHASKAKGGSARWFVVSRTMGITGSDRKRERKRGKKEIFHEVSVVLDLYFERIDEPLLLLLALQARRVSKLHFTGRCVSLAPTPEVRTFGTETRFAFFVYRDIERNTWDLLRLVSRCRDSRRRKNEWLTHLCKACLNVRRAVDKNTNRKVQSISDILKDVDIIK